MTCCRSSLRSSSPACTGAPAYPLWLLGPEHVADHTVAVGVGCHHDGLAVVLGGLLNDLLGSVARPEHVAIGLEALTFEPPDRLCGDVLLLAPLGLRR